MSVEFLELELGEKLNPVQKRLVQILETVDFDFEEFEPVFVKFSNTSKIYLYQARIDALVDKDDVVVVPVFLDGYESFKIANVSLTFQDLKHFNDGDIDFPSIESSVEKFNNVRHIVSNLGKTNGDFFSQYYEDTERKERKKQLLKKIKERSEKANKIKFYKDIAKNDVEMAALIEELEKLGGF